MQLNWIWKQRSGVLIEEGSWAGDDVGGPKVTVIFIFQVAFQFVHTTYPLKSHQVVIKLEARLETPDSCSTRQKRFLIKRSSTLQVILTGSVVAREMFFEFRLVVKQE